MRRLGLLFLSVLGLAGPACTRDDTQVAEKLDQINKKLDDLTKAVQAGARGGPGGARGQMPDRKRPEPNEVYAVDLGGSPTAGPKDAKVTIVEAFEFA
jgi:protein-disulfide isomerase